MRHDRISIDPNIMMGKPCIKGTRIPVEHILRDLGGGMTIAEILESYPRLSAEDIRAALMFAADYLEDEEVAYRFVESR